jgi:hypothetical protein
LKNLKNGAKIVKNKKKCFNCKVEKELTDFQIATHFVRPFMKERTVSCRLCNIERSVSWGGFITRVDGKVIFKEASEKEILEHFSY